MNELRTPLDHLAGLVAGVPDDDRPAAVVLAGVVVDLERMAGAELPGRDDVLPVLVRRFARAHRLLLRARSVDGDAAARVDRHAAVLRDPLSALMSAWRDLQQGDLQSGEPQSARRGGTTALAPADAARTASPQPC